MLSLVESIKSSLSKFDRLDPIYQTSKARIWWVGKDSEFLLAFVLRVEESVRFCPFYKAKHFLFKKTVRINAPSLFYTKWELKKQARRLKLEDGIWRLKLEERSFWPILRSKTLKKAEDQRAKLIFSKWARILWYNFGLFQQVFDNLKLNNLAKETRR